jgi:BirA family transcriptional regulator, biotin operon repressor / biotin---[acetyl-CoA-carboxylase] ligase
MRAPSVWLEVDEIPSTQDLAAQTLREGGEAEIVFARHQTSGRGRFGRPWHSERSDSLTCSLILRDWADHPRPYLAAMGVAAAAAGAIHCHLSWPNDLVEEGRKVGGILSELMPDDAGRRVPVLGIGINLNQASFPADIADRAASLATVHGGRHDAKNVLRRILDRIELLPKLREWHDLEPIWALFDRTPGKRYRLSTGEEAVAIGIGSEGQLLCHVAGESRSVMAAEALFGHS